MGGCKFALYRFGKRSARSSPVPSHSACGGPFVTGILSGRFAFFAPAAGEVPGQAQTIVTRISSIREAFVRRILIRLLSERIVSPAEGMP